MGDTQPTTDRLAEVLARALDSNAWTRRADFQSIINGTAERMPDDPEQREMYLRSAKRRVETVVEPSLTQANDILAIIARHRADLIQSQQAEIERLRQDRNEALCAAEESDALGRELRQRLAMAEADNVRLRAVMERCAMIVVRNLYHQREKVEDVPTLLRAALGQPGQDTTIEQAERS